MIRNILIASMGLILVAGAGCADNHAVLASLPAAAVQRDVMAPVPLARPAAAPPVRVVPVMGHLPQPGGAHPEWSPQVEISPRWTCMVIHHSAGEKGSPEGIDQYHRDRGWDEMGYHFLIGNGNGYPDGAVYVGTRWLKQKHGAHCKVPGNYYNEHGIGICLVGDLDEHPPTELQMQSLAQLVAFLEARCDIGPDRVLTHGGITGKTECPGRHFSINDLFRRMDLPAYASRR